MNNVKLISSGVLMLVSFLATGQQRETNNTPKKSTRTVCTNSTYRAAAEPLYIVNNVIVDKEFIKEIDPENIQSVSVLKEQEGRVLYGTNGKNGVIIIETKQAKQKKIKTFQKTEIGNITDTIQ